MQPPTLSNMSALGNSFRAARESKGLSLADVAERIHIRTPYLQALEAEDWSAIGPPVYVRGFVRSYARALGLDPEAAVARLSEEQRVGASAPAPPAGPPLVPIGSPPPKRNFVETRGRRSGLSAGAVVGLLVAFALVLLVGYQYFAFRANAVPLSASAPAVHARVAPRSHPARPAKLPEEHASGFALRLRDASWLRVTVDGKLAMEGTFPAGTERTFAGRALTVRSGNAGGVEISVDGHDLGPMGGSGDVAERSFQL